MRSSGTKRIIGVDMASQAKNTAAVWFENTGGGLKLGYTPGGVDNNRIREWLKEGASVLGIDAPFGWPKAFVDHVSWWQARSGDRPSLPSADGDRELLLYRVTDRFARRHGLGDARGPWPQGLSVTTNWISFTTMRLVELLSECAGPLELDRSGQQGPVLEVYPAAAFAQWQKYDGSYKPHGKSGPAKEKAIDRRKFLAEWLEKQFPAAIALPEGFAEVLGSNDHVLDAAVSALCTWAALVGCSYVPTDSRVCLGAACKHEVPADEWVNGFWNREKQLRGSMTSPDLSALASSEGWIQLPACRPADFLAQDPWPEVRRRTKP